MDIQLNFSLFLWVGTIAIGIATCAAIIYSAVRRAGLVANITFGVHVLAWLVSASCNATAAHILGRQNDPVSAYLIPAAMIVADISKVLLPHTHGYGLFSIRFYFVQFFRVISICMTLAFGWMLMDAASLKTNTAALQSERNTVAVSHAKASSETGTAPEQLAAEIAEAEATHAAAIAKIDDIYDDIAVNFAGQAAYNAKGKMSVFEATQGCSNASAFTRVPKNRCDLIAQLQTAARTAQDKVQKLTAKTAIDAANRSNYLSALDAAIETEKSKTATLDFESIALAIGGLTGTNPNNNNNIRAYTRLVVAFLISVLLEIVVTGTAPIDPKQKRWWQNVNWDALKSKPRQPQDETIPKPLIDQFAEVNEHTLSKFMDLPAAARVLGIRLKDLHIYAIVNMAQLYGENIATGAFHAHTREKFGEGKGIGKEPIGEAKQLMAAHGYLIPVPHGNGTSYQWPLDGDMECALYDFLRAGFRSHSVTPARPVDIQPQLKLVG